ncbi:MAG: tetratricopeptide repeat protein [Bacteroidales bacterium]|nr:tetratricopeptide repeat protein [Bacteroidales bacterium]
MLKYSFIIICLSLFLVSCNNGKTKLPEDILNDTTLTIEQINELIRDNPKNADLFIKRSMLYMEQKNTKEAINDLEIALKVDTTRQELYLQLSDLYLTTAQSEKSKNILELCIYRYPKNADAKVELAKIYFYVQMYTEAMSQIIDMERYNLQNSDSYFVKALILNETAAYEDATKALKKSIEYDNKNWEAYNLIGLVYEKMKDPLAVEYFKTAVNLFPDNAEIHYNAGWVFQQFGNIDGAVEQYELAIKLDEHFYEAYYNLGYLYVNSFKDYKKATDFFSGAIKCDSTQHKAWYNRGYTYEMTKQYKLAETDYRKALELYPNYDPAVEGLNLVLEKMR